MTNNKEILKDFLTNNSTRTATADNGSSWQKLFYKLQINKFDLIYKLDLYSGAPQIRGEYGSKAEFCGIIDRRSKKLYFIDYSIYKYFEDRETGERLAFVAYDSVIEQMNSDIIKALDKMAPTIADDLQPDANALYMAKNDAPNFYYYDKTNQYKHTPGTSRDRTAAQIFAYIENPAETIAQILRECEADKDETKHPAQAIKYNKMMARLAAQERQNIETAPEFEPLRLAKEIKKTIPADAKQINFIYKLSNGETLAGKIEADALRNMPNGLNYAAFSSWNTDATTRRKLEQIEGRANDDIKTQNIIKLTYNGRTIWQNSNQDGRA